MEKEEFMRQAIREAEKARTLGEVPIGAVVVLDGKIIGRGHNLRETSQNAITHAEVLAIQDACKTMESWRLSGADLYVTLEPCPMCSGAILLSRINKVFYGASDPKAGTAGTLMNLLQDDRFNHTCEVEQGVLQEETSRLLTHFFRELRERKKNKQRTKKTDRPLCLFF
ncbi:tRNA-specific adenosine deaminase [Listeria floridensis FSL S10-1187]|uniref:tRNA-specific adenosine deaminase n=1 Tax=Listeria floridensis FSL S10-1187 TaxID=1265817 RepID=A0ABN0RE71_9LIST|nr:tRNA adenosine(34) deaminase TadA [Listeria floridensis]EUJ30938.1 tRNA-specific adenosine deaminase [Listeria floridensis FSL S10-1187]